MAAVNRLFERRAVRKALQQRRWTQDLTDLTLSLGNTLLPRVVYVLHAVAEHTVDQAGPLEGIWKEQS